MSDPTRPSMTESEYAARLAEYDRATLLKLCRAAGLSAHRLTSNAKLVHLLWVYVGKPNAERYTERVNAALSNLGCEKK